MSGIIDFNHQLGYKERDKLYQKEYSSLKIKIALNCFEIFAIFIFTALGLYALMNTAHNWEIFFTPIAISIVISLIITIIFFKVKNYKVSISRFDKEDLYKKVSKELFNKAV